MNTFVKNNTLLVTNVLFNPLQITGLVGWWDAADAATLTYNGSLVSQWADKSNNSYHLTQSVTNHQPSYTFNAINTLPVIDFSDTYDFLTNTDISISPPFSLFMVAKLNLDGALACHYFDGGVDINERVFFRSDGSTGSATFQAISRNIDEGDGSGIEDITSTWQVGLNPHILQVYDAGNIINGSSVWANGTQITAGSLGAERLLGITVGNWILHQISNFNGLRGYIGEITIVNGTIGTDQRQKMEGYLAHKWGLTADLPNAHPYKTSPPKS